MCSFLSERALTARTVALAGATGLVGRAILEGLLADPSIVLVHALGRRELPVADRKLASHVVDFAALPPLPPLDEVYLALGTTIKVAGSQATFRAVDFDANLTVARAALAAGARRAGLVSAMGADANSRVFYNRVKGELEDALAQLPFAGLVIARPSLLVGDRRKLDQPERPLYKRPPLSANSSVPSSGKLPAHRGRQSRAGTACAGARKARRVVLLSGAMQNPR